MRKNQNYKNLINKKINNIEIAFLDIYGKLREIIIPKTELNKAFSNELKCDGCSIGEKNITESDLSICLDYCSYYKLPNNNLLLIVHTNYEYDARKKLINLENNLKKYGQHINFGIELEFFLSKNNKLDKLGYYEIYEEDEFNCLNEIMLYCQKINFPITSFHHECGKGQFEINFKYNSPHKTADNLIFLKKIIIFFAKKYNFCVFFNPKPFSNECGNGLHTNISIFKNNINLFYDKKDKNHLSKMGYDFANGIINHIESICAISNPTENSYDRLKFGTETPKEINISYANRNSLLRIPISNQQSSRIEFRLPDSSSNPYLLFCAIILCGFDKNYNITSHTLPKSKSEALNHLKNDKLLNKLVPEFYYNQ